MPYLLHSRHTGVLLQISLLRSDRHRHAIPHRRAKFYLNRYHRKVYRKCDFETPVTLVWQYLYLRTKFDANIFIGEGTNPKWRPPPF